MNYSVTDVKNFPSIGGVHQVRYPEGFPGGVEHRLITIMGEKSVEGEWVPLTTPATLQTPDGRNFMILDDSESPGVPSNALIPYDIRGIHLGIDVVKMDAEPVDLEV